MFIPDKTFAELHRQLVLERKAKLRMITDNNKLRRILQEIKAIAEMDICSNCITQKREINCQCLADTILQKITKAEEY